MANINPTYYRLGYKNEADEISTLRLADMILFGKIDPCTYSSGYAEIHISCDRNVTWTCKGKKDINIADDSECFVYTINNIKYVKENKENYALYENKMEAKKKEDCLCDDSIHWIKHRKYFLSKVLRKWGIDTEKLSDSIERQQVYILDDKDLKKQNALLFPLYDAISACVNYFDQYGEDALLISSHRWALQDAVLPLMVEQTFYEGLRHNAKKIYDKLSFGKKVEFQQTHGLNEILEEETKNLQDKKQHTQQDYLTITNGQIFTFGKVCEWKVQYASFGQKWECTHHKYGMKVPQFTRLLDKDGKVLDETGADEKNAVWMNEEQRFVFTSRGTLGVDGERSFSRFLKFKTKFEACFPKEVVDLLCRHAERLMTNFSKHSDECIDYTQQMKSFENLPVIRDPKNGKYYFKNPSLQKDVEEFVSAAVNKEKQYLQDESTQNRGHHGSNNPNITPQGMTLGD